MSISKTLISPKNSCNNLCKNDENNIISSTKDILNKKDRDSFKEPKLIDNMSKTFKKSFRKDEKFHAMSEKIIDKINFNKKENKKREKTTSSEKISFQNNFNNLKQTEKKLTRNKSE
jgi:hypothetical protein